MKFSDFWATVVHQNNLLRIAVGCLVALNTILGVVVLVLGNREPLIIDRGCYNRAVTTTSVKHTEGEIKAFIEKAISQRFDSNAIVENGFISDPEKLNRSKEQEELRTRNMFQRALVNSIKIQGEKIYLETDRLIAVGQVRSVLPFPLLATVTSVDRSEGNPYGLLLLNVSTWDGKEPNQNEKKH